MSGAIVEVEVQDAEARAVLARLLAAGRDLTALMDSIGGGLVLSTSERFDTSKGPGGTAWLPSKRALARGGKTLLDTGRLRQSVTYVAGSDAVEVGTNTRYASIHQFGGDVIQHPYTRLNVHFTANENGQARFAKKGKGTSTKHVTYGERRITMPARPFLGIDAADEAMILHHGREFLASIIAEGGAA